MKNNKALEELKKIDNEIILLSQISGVLVWDQEEVPSKGVERRGEQLALLSSKVHDLVASEKVVDLVAQLEDQDLEDPDKALVRIYKKSSERSRKLDRDFVHHFSKLTTKSQSVWALARKEDDWPSFEPYLTELISLVKEKAEAYGYEDDPYDALLENFEANTKTKEVSKLFDKLKRDLQPLIENQQRFEEVDDTFLYAKYPIDKQKYFINEVLSSIGFEWERGVLGDSVHPYTISLGDDDIRITTRYTESSVASPLFSALHEGGHALYEMGCANAVTKGTALANGASLGFHESQSRLWENMIGRSKEFWSHFYPTFSNLFPLQTENIDLDHFVKAINKVKPSCIRVDADELTYNLHIILRFELERELLSGSLSVKDLPLAWNDKMKELLGVEVPNNKVGVLQDVHWSMGELGYFPTYTLGNLYAAQIFETMNKEFDVAKEVAKGNFSPIKGWLNENILQYGSIYEPKDIINKVCGSGLSTTHLSSYLVNKYRQGDK
ncbi:MAG: carboxypeptidase M32 [Sphaerochaetaceae bacterium]|jgi:carboxypeptidase Taq